MSWAAGRAVVGHLLWAQQVNTVPVRAAPGPAGAGAVQHFTGWAEAGSAQPPARETGTCDLWAAAGQPHWGCSSAAPQHLPPCPGAAAGRLFGPSCPEGGEPGARGNPSADRTCPEHHSLQQQQQQHVGAAGGAVTTGSASPGAREQLHGP